MAQDGDDGTPLSQAPGPEEIAAQNDPQVEAPFIPVAPIRPEHVENAVKFLSHPKVKGSPVKYRRSFLERKGLTAEEIDEAFRRVPDDATVPASNVLTSTNVSSQVGAATQEQLQPTNVILSPARAPAVLPGAIIAASPALNAQPAGSRSSWKNIALAVALLGSAGVGGAVLAKRFALPGLKTWLRSLLVDSPSTIVIDRDGLAQATEPKRNPAEEASEAVCTAVKLLLETRNEDRQKNERMVELLEEVRSTLGSVRESLVSKGPASAPDVAPAFTLADMRKELRAFSSTISEFSGSVPQGLPSQATTEQPQNAMKSEIEQLRFNKINREAVFEPVNAAKQINVATSAIPMVHTDRASKPAGTSDTTREDPAQAPHSASYLQVLEMLEKGQKPPGIREVDDKPPNPFQSPSNARLMPPLKPWERTSSSRNAVDDASSLGPSAAFPPGEQVPSSTPWWRKRNEPEALNPRSNVVISEVDPSEPVPVEASAGIATAWVPPPIPQPAYPGAADAILRRPSRPASESVNASGGIAEKGSATAIYPPPLGEPPLEAHPEGQQALDGSTTDEPSTEATTASADGPGEDETGPTYKDMLTAPVAEVAQSVVEGEN